MNNDRRIASFVVIALCAAFLAGPAGLSPRAEAGKYAKKQTFEGEIPPLEEGKARIYMVRTARTGTAIYVWTFADEQLLGATRGRTFAYADVEPGEYVIWGKAENVSSMRLTVEAGETYYVRHHLLMGFGKARVRIALEDEAEGRERLERLKKIAVLTDEGREKGREIAERLIELAREKADEDDPEG